MNLVGGKCLLGVVKKVGKRLLRSLQNEEFSRRFAFIHRGSFDRHFFRHFELLLLK